jgi:ABC-2 type transport system ATP-binding protein
MTAALRARALTKGFGSATVLRGIDIDLAPGECVGLHGAAGSGRTTLMRLLSTLIQPTSGTLEIAGFDTRTQREAARARVAHVGRPAVAGPRLMVKEYLEFCRRARGAAARDHNNIDRGVQLAALRADALVHELTPPGHWALALAAALVCRPSVTLIDAAPDDGAAEQRPAADAIAELLGQGSAVFVVLDPGAALRSSCHRILELRDGTLVQEVARDHAAEATFAYAGSR